MADTLFTIHLIASDPDFSARLNAGAAQQGVPGDPVVWVYGNRYGLAAAPSWAEKVDSWLVSNPDGGNAWALDQSVISDGDIVAQVQAMLGVEPVPDATWTTQRIADWLDSRGVSITPEALSRLTVAELLDLVADVLS